MQKPKIKDEITRLYCWQYTTSAAAPAAAVYHEEVFINCDFLPRNVKDKSFIHQAQPAPGQHATMFRATQCLFYLKILLLFRNINRKVEKCQLDSGLLCKIILPGLETVAQIMHFSTTSLFLLIQSLTKNKKRAKSFKGTCILCYLHIMQIICVNFIILFDVVRRFWRTIPTSHCCLANITAFFPPEELQTSTV